jgi:hypothetical protein
MNKKQYKDRECPGCAYGTKAYNTDGHCSRMNWDGWGCDYMSVVGHSHYRGADGVCRSYLPRNGKKRPAARQNIVISRKRREPVTAEKPHNAEPEDAPKDKQLSAMDGFGMYLNVMG